MIDFEKCEKIFIDFDGVIVDSNQFKELAIERSISKFIGKNKNTTDAINFFNINAGIGREKKLSKFFNHDQVLNILGTYSKECHNFFLEASPTDGIINFLKFLKGKSKSKKIYILSGGEKDEIVLFLKRNSLSTYFEDILSSDKSKIEHLQEKHVSKNDIFIGDSQNDLKAALETGIQFILFEKFKSSKSFPSQRLIEDNYLLKTDNFKSLMEEIKS